jgi:hypothetical protein
MKMVGIPKNLATKRDVMNLQEMAKNNLIDRKEWIARLEELKTEDTFNIPVLEKGDGFFIIPKTERELPAAYDAKIVTTLNEGGDEEQQNQEVYQIAGEIEGDFLTLKGGFQEADKLGLTQEEITKLIEELV